MICFVINEFKNVSDIDEFLRPKKENLWSNFLLKVVKIITKKKFNYSLNLATHTSQTTIFNRAMNAISAVNKTRLLVGRHLPLFGALTLTGAAAVAFGISKLTQDPDVQISQQAKEGPMKFDENYNQKTGYRPNPIQGAETKQFKSQDTLGHKKVTQKDL